MLARTQQCTDQLHPPLRSEDVSRFGIVCKSLLTLFYMKMDVCMNRAGWSLLNFNSAGVIRMCLRDKMRLLSITLQTCWLFWIVLLWLKGVSLDWKWEKGHALLIVESTKTIHDWSNVKTHAPYSLLFPLISRVFVHVIMCRCHTSSLMSEWTQKSNQGISLPDLATRTQAVFVSNTLFPSFLSWPDAECVSDCIWNCESSW